MMTKVPVPVRKEVLAWARKSASVTLDEAGKAAGVAPERVGAWENGEGTPTLPQLRKLATKYHRPLAVMLLPTPPRDFMPLNDFRRTAYRDEQPAPMPPRVAYEIRLAYERREIALDMLEETGGEARPFRQTATIDDNPEVVGAALRKFLGVEARDIRQWVRTRKVFDGWRAAIEARGVLVFVMGGAYAPRVRDVRGFAIPADTFPVVAVNGRDRTNGRTFTLLHEVAHLLIGEGVVENVVAPEPTMPVAVRRVERWCNAVAAATLMPAQTINEVAADKNVATVWDDAELARVAEELGVSREAALIRFVTLGRASRRSYFRKRQDFEKEYEALDEPTSINTPIPPYRTMVGKYGRTFARLVLSGYRDQRITLNEAAAFLGVQAKYVSYIERQAFRAA